MIRLVPGAFVEFHVDRPIKPTYGELFEWMRQMRGGVLSSSFGIENELVLLALAEKFGTNDSGSIGEDYFKQEQDWREDYRLDRKIERVKPIVRARRDQKTADEIIHKLASYRQLRNLLAHYPCWFEPVNDVDAKRTVGLKLFIADRTHQWEINEAQAKEWGDLLSFVRISVENIRREVIGAPPLNADGTPPAAPQQQIEHGGVSQRVF